jgi:D-alanyl-D-alanine carboxypeptidase/D-alanyl-D-alanine-endopeptidase (penicillin-binding protein 4)
MLASRISRPAALALIIATPALAQQPRQAGDPLSPLAQQIQQVIDRPEFAHAQFGIAFYSLDDGRTVYSVNPEKLFVAASTTKTLTMGTALALLGPDHRFHTRVYRTGPLDADGTLSGDLVLVASGDPNLSGRIRPGDRLAFENVDHAYDASPDTRAVAGDPLLVIRQLASRVAAAGVKRVTGRVLVDASLFPEGERELGTGVVISPIVVNDNLVDVTIGPGAKAGDPTEVRISPATAYVRFVNESRTGGADAKPFIRWSKDERQADGSRVVTITGVFPSGTKPILYSYAVPSPSRYAQVAFVQALREKGVAAELTAPEAQAAFTGAPDAYIAPALVAEHVSPPFTEEVKVTLKVSQNLHASAMPFVLKGTLARGDTGRTGFDLEREFLERAGLDLGGAYQSDGAGGDAAFSPEFMVRYLAYQDRQPYAAAFRSALPVLGKDGTLWNVQTSSPAAGHVMAKTGTFGRYDALNRRLLLTAKGLAGYLTTASGRRYALAVYVNNVSVSLEPDQATKVAGQALGEIAAAGYRNLP